MIEELKKEYEGKYTIKNFIKSMGYEDEEDIEDKCNEIYDEIFWRMTEEETKKLKSLEMDIYSIKNHKYGELYLFNFNGRWRYYVFDYN